MQDSSLGFDQFALLPLELFRGGSAWRPPLEQLLAAASARWTAAKPPGPTERSGAARSCEVFTDRVLESSGGSGGVWRKSEEVVC